MQYENTGATTVAFTPDELREIKHPTPEITPRGNRSPGHLEKLTGREGHANPVNIVIAITFLLVLPRLHAGPQHPTVDIPKEIRVILDREYPGWELSRLNEPWEIAQWKKRKANPSFISGDFNGDGRNDVALIVVHSVPSSQQKERTVIVFLRDRTSYRNLVLESGAADPALDVTLRLMKKGSKGLEVEQERKFTYRFDAIDVAYSDKGSQSYIWNDGTFETITTGD